jgi:hypothetical protein
MGRDHDGSEAGVPPREETDHVRGVGDLRRGPATSELEGLDESPRRFVEARVPEGGPDELPGQRVTRLPGATTLEGIGGEESQL